MSGFSLSGWAVRNPIAVVMLFAALCITGALAYPGLPVKYMPKAVNPRVAVTVTENGAAASDMETQVTRPIEDALASLTDVRNVQSVVVNGASRTIVQFEVDANLDKAAEAVRAATDKVRSGLPRDIDPPFVERLENETTPILTYAVAAPGRSLEEVSWFVDDAVARALQGQPDIALVSRLGGVGREITVTVDPGRLAAHGLTIADLNAALRSYNSNAAGGRFELGGRRQTVRILGSALNVEELRRLTLPAAGGFVTLGDVAEVGQGEAEPAGFARLNGRPVVGFEVYKTQDGSETHAEARAEAIVAQLAHAHPEMQFTRIYSTVDNTRATLDATRRALVEGMLLTTLVVFAFLRDWRATLIAAIAMPVSLLPSFAVMALLGFSLNIVSLLALTLIIGILVDDAIVEIENIQKRIASGEDPRTAAIRGADQIGLPVVATTAAVAVIFGPISFLHSLVGQYFREFGLTVVAAVTFSLLVARLLTPLLAAHILRPAGRATARRALAPAYAQLLDWTLRHKWATCGLAALLFVATTALAVLLPTGFQPPSNADYMFLALQGPPGASLNEMARISNDATGLLRTLPEARSVFVVVGSAGGYVDTNSSLDDTRGRVTLILKPDRRRTVSQIQEAIRDRLRGIPDARVSFEGGGYGAAGVHVVLTGDDGPLLERTAEVLQRQIRTLRTVAEPRPAAAPVGPEAVIRPRIDEAARLGVTTEAIAEVARIASLGDIDANVSKLTQGEVRIPVRLRFPQDERSRLSLIGAMQVPTAGGGLTPLSNVADIEIQAGPSVIRRLDRRRQVGVDADLPRGVQLGEALRDIRRLPVMRSLPPGVRLAQTGEAEEIARLFRQMGFGVLAGVGLMYVVLTLLFRSPFKPVVILSALPLAPVGAFAGLLAMRSGLNVPSLIGLLMLFGLAAKNSILLVEHAQEAQRHAVPRAEALIEACRERARPIVMTSIAMAAGMAPTALGLGTGAEFRQPMAAAVIGGLLTSTLLSLVVVPAVYEVIDDIEAFVRRRSGAGRRPRISAPGERAAETEGAT